MNELYHYGVKGMRWGVRKEVYESASRSRKKEIKKEYYKTPEGRIKKATTIGTILGGPFGGIIAGSIISKKIKKELNDIKNNKLSSIDKNIIKKGKNKVSTLLNNSDIETYEQNVKRIVGEIDPTAKFSYDGTTMRIYWDD